MNQFLWRLKNKFVRPFNTGYLPKKDGHSVFFQELGNPHGQPVICFHGGPGGSAGVSYAHSYNRKKYRIILFDQRGCGQSLSDDVFYRNTINDTVQDAFRLLGYLGITGKVMVAGCSWGSSCAVHFAETYPDRVSRLLIYAVFLARDQDAECMSPIAKFFYPDAVHVLQNMADKKTLDDYFGDLLFSSHKKKQKKAMRYYKRMEIITGRGKTNAEFPKLTDISQTDVRKFQIFMHYKRNHFFLSPNQLLKNAGKIAHIPTEIYQNRLDFCCPPYQAWSLHQALPKSRLHMIPARGHIGDQMFWQMYLDNITDYK